MRLLKAGDLKYSELRLKQKLKCPKCHAKFLVEGTDDIILPKEKLDGILSTDYRIVDRSDFVDVFSVVCPFCCETLEIRACVGTWMYDCCELLESTWEKLYWDIFAFISEDNHVTKKAFRNFISDGDEIVLSRFIEFWKECSKNIVFEEDLEEG